MLCTHTCSLRLHREDGSKGIYNKYMIADMASRSRHNIYFEKIHPYMPIIHKARYFASFSMAPNIRPPVALRYAIWALAASVSDDHGGLQTHFYRRARKCLEELEMKGHGEGIISVASPQAWLLITAYEFKHMYFPRAWMSTGRAIRLSQMMGLHRLDGSAWEVKQCLPAPKDWIEREERRRTFWTAFCWDRYASIGTGWPLCIEEKDVLSPFAPNGTSALTAIDSHQLAGLGGFV